MTELTSLGHLDSELAERANQLSEGRKLMEIEEKAAPEGMSFGILQGGGGFPTRRNTLELLKAYSEMPWLRAIVNKVGRSVGSTTWKLFAARNSGGKFVNPPSALRSGSFLSRFKVREVMLKQGDLVEIENNTFFDLMDRGNDSMPGMVVVQLVQAYLDLVGEAYLTKVRGVLNIPTDLWPIPPNWVSSTPFLDGNDDTYTIQYRSWRKSVDSRDMIRFIDPDPVNPYGRGSGIAGTLADELEADELAAKHIGAYFHNGARPDIIVGVKGNKDAAKAVEAKWLEKFGGPHRRRRPLITPMEAIDVQEIGQTFHEMSLVPLREFERNTIVQVYGFPPELFGILQNSNRATIESAEFLYAKHVLSPRIEYIRTVLQEFLIPDFDERLILDYESPVQEDKEHKRQVYSQAPWAFKVNEHRMLAGEEELPGKEGELHPMPFNLHFDSLSSSQSEPVEPEPDPEPDVDPDPDEDNEPDDQVMEVWKNKVVFKINDSELQVLLNEITNRRNRTTVWGTVSNRLRDIVEEHGANVLFNLNSEIQFEATELVAEFQRNFALNRSRLIDETTKARLRAALADAVQAGATTNELKTVIQSIYAEASKSRAFMIARTETTRAVGFASQEAMRQAGVENKEWLSTRDDRVRDAHVDIDGQVVNVLDNFIITSGEFEGASALYPGDFGVAALDIHCRCASVSSEQVRAVLNTEEKKAAFWRAFEKERIVFERSLRPVIRTSFRRQERLVLDRLEQLAG